MTNPISSVPGTPVPPEAPAPQATGAAPKSEAAPSAATSQSDSVTISADAQASTQLLSAARDAPGIDAQAVERIRSALAGGSYNVAAEDLAQAIATVLKETN